MERVWQWRSVTSWKCSNRECVTMEKFFIRVSDAIERVWQYKECDIRARVANTECGNA